MIKNAVTYTVELPNTTAMEPFMADYMSAKPDFGQVSTVGFIHHPITTELVSGFNGGYCLAVRTWEKKIDQQAVKAEVESRINNMTLDRKATKKERESIKDDVVCQLLKTTLPSPKINYVYYHELSNTMIIDTTVDKICDSITSLLRKAIGSLKATTLYVDSRIGLTEKVAGSLGCKTPVLTEELSIRHSLELKGGEANSTLNFKNIDLFDDTTIDEIVGQITGNSMYVKSIELHHDNYNVTFNLLDGAKFKNLAFNGLEPDDSEDAYHNWCVETYYAVNTIKSISRELVQHFTVVDGE